MRGAADSLAIPSRTFNVTPHRPANSHIPFGGVYFLHSQDQSVQEDSSEMLRHVDWKTFTDVSNEHSAFIFTVDHRLSLRMQVKLYQ